jgi:hypothetical protein
MSGMPFVSNKFFWLLWNSCIESATLTFEDEFQDEKQHKIEEKFAKNLKIHMLATYFKHEMGIGLMIDSTPDKCTQCGKFAQHNWYCSEDACELYRKCVSCGLKETHNVTEYC